MSERDTCSTTKKLVAQEHTAKGASRAVRYMYTFIYNDDDDDDDDDDDNDDGDIW